ncbi:MAG: MBL fold metallo-hydrolase [Pseudomonadota bacterium]
MLKEKEFGPVRQFMMGRDFWGRTVYVTSAYLVDGLLIDSGPAHEETRFVEALRPFTVEKIVNTHSHEDHIGANARLARSRGVGILAHAAALPVLADPRRHLPLKPYQKILWGLPRPSQGAVLPERVETDSYCFQVIHTPGHSPDHVCLFEASRGWLFTGDAYVGGRDQVLRADYDIRGVLGSLRKMAELPLEVMFAASGSVKEKPLGAIREKISYLEELGEKIRDLFRQGLTNKEINRKLFGPEKVIRYYTQGHFSGKNLVRSFLEDRPQ